MVRRQGSEQKPVHKACLEHDFLVLVLEVCAAALAATVAIAAQRRRATTIGKNWLLAVITVTVQRHAFDRLDSSPPIEKEACFITVMPPRLRRLHTMLRAMRRHVSRAVC